MNILNESFALPNNKNIKIGIYNGSFDPFHNGHYEVAINFLKYVDYLIISMNNKNSGKPNRLSVNHRAQMIYHAVSDHIDRIMVLLDPIDETIDKLRENNFNELVGIMGNDSMVHVPRLKVNNWLIVPRLDAEIKINSQFTVPYTILPKELFSIQNYSSTFVKKQLLLERLENIPLHREVLKYIQNNDLYNEYCIVKTQFGNENIHKIKKNIYMLKDSSQIVKLFIDETNNNLKKYDLEIESYKISSVLPINVPHIISSYKTDLYGQIVESCEGSSLDNILNNPPEDYFRAGFAIGQAFKSLHSFYAERFTYDEFKRQPKAIKIINKYKLSDDYFSEDDLPAKSYVHGDASLANVIIDPVTYKVTFIDLNGIATYIKDDIPFGLACYEYYQFFSSIPWLKNTEAVNGLSKGFVDGYGITGFPKKLENLVKDHWQV
jgi:cytidyltransferase-like protein